MNLLGARDEIAQNCLYQMNVNKDQLWILNYLKDWYLNITKM